MFSQGTAELHSNVTADLICGSISAGSGASAGRVHLTSFKIQLEPGLGVLVMALESLKGKKKKKKKITLAAPISQLHYLASLHLVLIVSFK